MSTITKQFDEVVEKREKAVCFSIEGKNVWLPKQNLQVVGSKVSHPLLEQQLRMSATSSGEAQDLGPVIWKNPNGKSVAFDTYLRLDEGDPELSETKVRVFVPTKVETGSGVPMWLIAQALERQASLIMESGEAWTLYNSDEQAILSSSDQHKADDDS